MRQTITCFVTNLLRCGGEGESWTMIFPLGTWVIVVVVVVAINTSTLGPNNQRARQCARRGWYCYEATAWLQTCFYLLNACQCNIKLGLIEMAIRSKLSQITKWKYDVIVWHGRSNGADKISIIISQPLSFLFLHCRLDNHIDDRSAPLCSLKIPNSLAHMIFLV